MQQETGDKVGVITVRVAVDKRGRAVSHEFWGRGGCLHFSQHQVVLMELDCQLEHGIVPVGVCSELKAKGVAMVLGDDLAGSHVGWCSTGLPVLLVFKLVFKRFSRIFPAFDLTHRQSYKESAPHLSGLGDSESEVLGEDLVQSKGWYFCEMRCCQLTKSRM